MRHWLFATFAALFIGTGLIVAQSSVSPGSGTTTNYSVTSAAASDSEVLAADGLGATAFESLDALGAIDKTTAGQIYALPTTITPATTVTRPHARPTRRTWLRWSIPTPTGARSSSGPR